jgi:hypothetical protein
MFRGNDLSGRIIHANISRRNVKPDFYVHVDGIPVGRYVSVKKGGGNSIHQEPLDQFCDFLSSLGANEDVINALRLYHFGDGTTNNTGKIRMKKASEVANAYSEEVKLLNDFLNDKTVMRAVLNRAMFHGNLEDAEHADYMYHGTPFSGVWASRDEITRYFMDCSYETHASVHSGFLTYQVWNRNVNRNPKTENRRYASQIKCGALERILMEITSRREEFQQTGTYIGDMSEKASVIFFNRNPSLPSCSKYLKAIAGDDARDILLVRVTTKQPSTLHGKKVMTRADAYAIKMLDKKILNILSDNGFYLDEEILSNHENLYEKIPGSGISIKMFGSNAYQLLKMTPDSFNTLFGNYTWGAAASLYCLKEQELKKNIDVISGWKTTINDMKNEFKFFAVTEENLTTSTDFCSQIKNYSESCIDKKIKNDPKLQREIFNGEGLYKEPYSAYFFMQDYEIKKLGIIPYSITTGSGRSKGKYSLVLKPSKNNV